MLGKAGALLRGRTSAPRAWWGVQKGRRKPENGVGGLSGEERVGKDW